MDIRDWQSMSPAQRRAALERPSAATHERTLTQAQAIIDGVRADGDTALARYTRDFDGVELTRLQVTAEEFTAAGSHLQPEQHAALERAIANVEAFHRAALPAAISLEVQPGVRCERLIRPIDAVGLYVPAGSAPLPSTVYMLAVPARLAGCPQRVLCTPPLRDGFASAAVLVAARLCGIDQVFKVGGAQAIAALAYGTQSVPKVAKIFGPGNAWVTAAKQRVAADPDGAALDMPAGPSEVLVIADESARADFIASDLLGQAEHDPRSQALLVTPSRELAQRVAAAVERQLPALSRTQILSHSLAASRILLVSDLGQALEVSNTYAPEHLIIDTRSPRALLDRVTNAGSVFLGAWSPVTMGDYCSGTNHVLPTYGYARAYSGLAVLDFTRRMTVQELQPEGLRALGPTASTLAQLEGLDAHVATVALRLEALRAGSGA